jgi:hypothetical protein
MLSHLCSLVILCGVGEWVKGYLLNLSRNLTSTSMKLKEKEESKVSRTKRREKQYFGGKKNAYVASKDKGALKFEPEHGQGLGISATAKLVAKNANRSRKKGARQEAKKSIIEQLNIIHEID